MVADHLLRLKNAKELLEDAIQETFPDELLLVIEAQIAWYVDYVNYIACEMMPPNFSSH